MAEQLIVYGVNCVWWDKIERAGLRTVPVPEDLAPEFKRQLRKAPRLPRLPCCPKCGSVLMQVEETQWWKNMDDYEAGRQRDGVHPGYRKLMEWLRGRCYPDLATAKIAYARATAGKPS